MDEQKIKSELFESQFESFNTFKQCRYGKMLYNIHDIYIGKALDEYGEYSQAEVDIFNKMVKPGQLVLDIGANIGCHTLFFAKKVGPKGAVLAIEPQRIIFQTLCANLALNSITNTYCEHIALGEVAGHCILPSINYQQEANYGAVSLDNFQNIEKGEKTLIKTIDAFGFPRCDFIKIDVEGMEASVIKGAENTIKKFKPILFVENDRLDKSEALIGLIEQHGYNLYWAVTPLYNPNNFLNNHNNIYGKTISVNMLCVHKTRSQSIELPKVKDVTENYKQFIQRISANGKTK